MCTTHNAPVRQFYKVCEILEHHNHSPAQLIPILHKVQKEYRYLPEEVLTYVATSLHIPPAKVFGVATFFSHFSLVPKGKHVVKICDGTACHVKNSTVLLEGLKKHLQIPNDKTTSLDMLFTVETVSCIGACGLAPVVLVDEDVHGQLTLPKAIVPVQKIVEMEAK